MILYHGSNIAVEHPQIITSEVGRDFGFAFYTTDIKEQAIRWARRKAKIFTRKHNQKSIPVISVYEWNESASLETLSMKEFKHTDLEWLDMVLKCRSDISYQHEYDIITGRIANDNVGETVSYVLQGIMRKEDAVERLKFEEINNQIVFCTKDSLNFLEYKGSFEGWE